MAEASAFGTIKDGRVFRKAFLDFPEREIGEVKETEEATLQYFEERFALVEKEVSKVEEKINNTDNKGSYLMKILHLKETLPEKDALGDFEALYLRVCRYEDQLKALIAENREKNLDIKRALLDELKEVAKSSEWKSASDTVKTIQAKWLKTGAVAEELKEEIEESFTALTNAFYERRASFYADLEKMMEEKEENYKDFLKKAEGQLKGASMATLKQLNASLMEEWKGLGRIKKSSQNEFWERFQSIMKAAWNEAKKTKKSSNKADFEANKRSKEEFIEKLKSLNEALEPKADLGELKRQWKQLGPVAKSDAKSLQEAYLLQYDLLSEKRFLQDMVNKRRKGKDSDLNRLRQRILRDLLDRDVRELDAFRENLDKFNASGNFQEMIGGKLERQERKVKVKKMIMSQLKDKK